MDSFPTVVHTVNTQSTPIASVSPRISLDAMQTTNIEATGELIDAMTDHAETLEEVEANVRMLFDPDGGGATV